MKLEYTPLDIKASRSTLCVKSIDDKINFYNLKNLLIHKFDHGDGKISEIDSNFYELIIDTKKIYCYNENGDLKQEVSLTEDFENMFVSSADGGLLIFNEDLLLISCFKKQVIKFH